MTVIDAIETGRFVLVAPKRGRKDNDVNRPVTVDRPFIKTLRDIDPKIVKHLTSVQTGKIIDVNTDTEVEVVLSGISSLSEDHINRLYTFFHTQFPNGAKLAFGDREPIVGLFAGKDKESFSRPKGFTDPEPFMFEVVGLLEQISGTALESMFTVKNIISVAKKRTLETLRLEEELMVIRSMSRSIR